MLRSALTVAVVVTPALVLVAAAGAVPASAQRTCRGHAATIVGTAGDDRLAGTRGADVVAGMGGDDRLFGFGGDDVLCGGPGADDLVGGRGSDRLYGGRDDHEQRPRRTVVAGDLLEGGPGDDYLRAGVDELERRATVRRPNIVSFRHSTRPVTVDLRDRVAVGEGSDVVVRAPALEVDGSPFDDVLLGSRVVEVLDGGSGDDDLRGRGGGDVLIGYQGDDGLAGGSKQDLVISTAGGDTVDGGDGADFLIAAGPATTTLLGGPGADYMSRTIYSGQTGVIDGGPGQNQLELDAQLWFGRDRSATLEAEAGTAIVTAGSRVHTTTFANMDSFTLESVPWTFRGTDRDDFVQVVFGRLQAEGRGGDDVFIGDERNDVLDGGDGTDAVWGGGGRNTCLNAESGSCTGYPWNARSVSAREALGVRNKLSTFAPHKLVSRWVSR